MKVEYGFLGVKLSREISDGAMTWVNCFIEKGACVLSVSWFADRVNMEGRSLRAISEMLSQLQVPQVSEGRILPYLCLLYLACNSLNTTCWIYLHVWKCCVSRGRLYQEVKLHTIDNVWGWLGVLSIENVRLCNSQTCLHWNSSNSWIAVQIFPPPALVPTVISAHESLLS